MKKVLFSFAVTAIAVCVMAACGNKSQQNAEAQAEGETAENTEKESPEDQTEDFWDIDFPKSINIGKVEPGQFVITSVDYLRHVSDGRKASGFGTPTRLGEVASQTETGVVLKKQDAEIPSSIVIPIPEGQKAKVGDILVTANGGIARAIVTDASNPSQPKVVFLDLDWKEDGTGRANKSADTELPENTFMPLKGGSWVPGVSVARKQKYGWHYYILVHEYEDKLLVATVSNRLEVVPKNECKALPLGESVKVGDVVSFVRVSDFEKKAKVTKIDARNGQVFLEGDRGRTYIKSIIHVTKSLEW